MGIEVLLGKTIVDIKEDGEELFLSTSDGKDYKMYHEQDCCESVRIEEIIGSLTDLLDNPILLAEEVSNPATKEETSEYGTWTFYKLSTIKGSVTIRWLGESNGYYSERVTFEEI